LITADDYRFYSNQNGDYWLKIDEDCRAVVWFDDSRSRSLDDDPGGVTFTLAEFAQLSAIPDAIRALEILIGDLLRGDTATREGEGSVDCKSLKAQPVR
jgi:hypothetical protein